MKITIDCRFIGNSGIGTFIDGIVRSMVYNHSENEYYLIVENNIEEYMSLSNVFQIKTQIKPFTIRELFFFPIKTINRTDVFFSPYINIPIGIKIPVYCTIHDVIFWDVPKLVSKLGLLVRTLVIRHAIKVSKAIITVSNFSKKRIIKHFHTTKKIIVVPNGIADHIKHYQGPIEKDDYILFVGNIKPHKGLRVLIEAYRKAKEAGLSSSLKIVGEKDNFRTNDDFLRDNCFINENIVFTGKLSNEELVHTIAKAKVLVLPSIYEGFGIPPMEALYLGTNTIISDIDVLKEIYADLPVTFFKSGDSSELANKLISIDKMNPIVSYVKSIIDNKFSYSLAADTILSEIGKVLKL